MKTEKFLPKGAKEQRVTIRDNKTRHPMKFADFCRKYGGMSGSCKSSGKGQEMGILG
jgi:hypothetical protein